MLHLIEVKLYAIQVHSEISNNDIGNKEFDSTQDEIPNGGSLNSLGQVCSYKNWNADIENNLFEKTESAKDDMKFWNSNENLRPVHFHIDTNIDIENDPYEIESTHDNMVIRNQRKISFKSN